MKKIYSIFLVIGAICFLPLLGLSQAEFKVKVNRDRVPLNRTLQITYTVKNGEKVSGFNAPNFNPFKSRGPSTSTQMQIINGSMSKSESYSYTLSPTKIGSFTIPPASIQVNGKTLKTESVTIQVVNKIAQDDPDASNRNGGISDAEIAENIFVRVIPNKSEVYKGEQLTLTYKLYTRLNTRNINYANTPQYNGFLQNELEISGSENQVKVDVYNGKEYRTQVFKKVALFPTQAGTLDIPPISFKADVLLREQDSFFGRNSFFTRTRAYPFEFNSNGLKIKSKELPPPPRGYTGGVGDLKYQVKYDKTQVKTDDAITLKIDISGVGNISLINVPELVFPSSFEVYDPEIKERVNKKGNRISGSKSYKYLIIPRGGGEFQMPDIFLSHFDSDKGKYISKPFPGPVIKVEGESIEGGSGLVLPGTASKISALNEDIRYLKTGNIDQYRKSSIINSPIYWVISLFTIASLFFIPFIVRKFRNQRALKSASGAYAAQKSLKSLSELRKNTDLEKPQVLQVIWNYISEKTQTPLANLNKDRARLLLQEVSRNTPDVEGLMQTMDRCEEAAYMPSTAMNWDDIIDSAIENIKAIDS